jgi:hypothetical protein
MLFRASSCRQGHQSNLAVVCNRTPFQDSSSVASSAVPVVRMIAASLLEFAMKSDEWHVPQNEQSRMTQDSAELYL